MTNEEKVDVLVSNYYINESDSPEKAQGVRYGAEKMAEWKDQQFKEYLEKRIIMYEHLIKQASHEKRVSIAFNDKADAIKRIINELFGEEVKVDNSDNDE